MKKHLLAAGFLLASLSSSHALLLSFDSGPITNGSGDPLTSTFTINFAFLETVDGNGDPLATPSWTIDSTAPAVTAGSPTAAGYGPSTSNALDVRDQPVMFTFANPVNLAGFSTVLDNSSFGNLGTEQIKFYNTSNALLNFINVNQTIPGFMASTNTAMTGVKKIVLPTTAFYDNVQLTPSPAPIPEPGLTALAGLSALGLGLRRRRAAV